MTIGGWDISQADARQWNVVAGHPALTNQSEWGAIAPHPFMATTFYGFRDLSITVIVKVDGGRQALRKRCSDIISHSLTPCEIVLDKFDTKFFGILQSVSHNEMSMRHWHSLTLQFKAYEYGPEVTVTKERTTSFTITNAGNIITPVRLEITPLVAAASVVLSGLCIDQTGKSRDITIKNTTTNKAIVLDGETGLFTEDGENKAKDIEIWGLPAIKAGENAVTVNNAFMSVVIKYKPRYI